MVVAIVATDALAFCVDSEAAMMVVIAQVVVSEMVFQQGDGSGCEADAGSR